MLISTREAASRLGAAGLTRRQADNLLASGIAGTPLSTGTAVLWDEQVVAALASRPELGPDDVHAACPWGLFVARRTVDQRCSPADQLDTVREGWPVSPLTRVLLRARVERFGHLPLVATTHGFVVLGADITGVAVVRQPDGVEVASLDLRQAGEWYSAFDRARLRTGRGRPWVLLEGASGSPGPATAVEDSAP